MAHKVNPKSFRIGVTKDWDSRWFTHKRKSTPFILEEDFKIRNFLLKNLKGAGLDKINIDRIGINININIFAAKPGLIIGRGGKGVEDVKNKLIKIITQHRKEYDISEMPVLFINIEEVKNPMASAAIVAQMIVEELEKRMPFRRVLKRTIEQVIKNREVQGVKIRLSGRLGGTDIARSEWLNEGRMPLQTFRADIDYVSVVANDPFVGVIGIKVWIYKGEVFEKEGNSKKEEQTGEVLFPKMNINN